MYHFFRALAWCCITYALVCIGVYATQESLMFHPSQRFVDREKPAGTIEVRIRNRDGNELRGWYQDNGSKNVVLFLHGNAWNLGQLNGRFEVFAQMKISALAIDYRGYGLSDGKISEEADFYEDAEAAYEWLVDRWYRTAGIIPWGHSLGAAIAIRLSSKMPVGGTIAESPFLSMSEMAKRTYPYLPTGLLLKYPFRSDQRIVELASPILVLHSRADEVIPFSQWETLYASAKGKKEFVEISGGHNDWFLQSRYLAVPAVRSFMDSLPKPIRGPR